MYKCQTYRRYIVFIIWWIKDLFLRGNMSFNIACIWMHEFMVFPKTMTMSWIWRGIIPISELIQVRDDTFFIMLVTDQQQKMWHCKSNGLLWSVSISVNNYIDLIARGLILIFGVSSNSFAHQSQYHQIDGLCFLFETGNHHYYHPHHLYHGWKGLPANWE